MKSNQLKVLERLATGQSLCRDQTRARIGDRFPCYRFNDLERPISSTTVSELLEKGYVSGYEIVEITQVGKEYLNKYKH